MSHLVPFLRYTAISVEKTEECKFLLAPNSTALDGEVITVGIL